MEGGSLFVIHKVTFAYRPVEDRICVSAATPTGEALRLWLTRRLTCQFIPYLPLGKKATDDEYSDGTTAAAADQAVDADSGNSSAVECDASSDEFLIVSIDIKHHEEQWSLVFKDANDEHRAALTFGLDVGHQIADALNTCFQVAGWSKGEWGKATPDFRAPSLGEVTIH